MGCKKLVHGEDFSTLKVVHNNFSTRKNAGVCLEYFAFGETFVEEHSNTDRTPYLFNGKELDEETGLYYYGARYYDPRTSVWQSVDPMTDHASDWSPYAYTFNNPILLRDPDGKWPGEGFFKPIGEGFSKLGQALTSSKTYEAIGKGFEQYGKAFKKDIADRVEVKVSDGSFGLKVGKVGAEVNYNSKELLTASTADGFKAGADNKATNGISVQYGVGELALETQTTTTNSKMNAEIFPGITSQLDVTTKSTDAKASLTAFGFGPQATKTKTETTVQGFGTSTKETPYNFGFKASRSDAPIELKGQVKNTKFSIGIYYKIEIGIKD